MLRPSNKQIENYVFIDSDIIDKPCDVAIVFGGTNMIPYRADKAIELYNNKLVKKILLTGGKTLFSKEIESILMLNYLLNNNIPKEDIILETKSKTTKQNIINSLKLINKETIILITSDFHLKRVKYLFKKYSNNKFYLYGTKDNITDKDNWYKTIKGRKQIIREYFLLKSLLVKKDD